MVRAVLVVRLEGLWVEGAAAVVGVEVVEQQAAEGRVVLEEKAGPAEARAAAEVAAKVQAVA